MRFRFKTLATIGICLPLLGGCGRVEYNSISISELEAREPFVATVEVVRIDDYRDKGGTFGLVVSIGLKTETGERILMGGMQEKDNMAEFARSLEERKVYEFPKVWLDYKARMKSVTN